MALSPSSSVTSKVKAAKASAQKVLDLVQALQAAEDALQAAREEATFRATQASEALASWLDEQRTALDAIEEAGEALSVIGDMSDDEALAVVDVSL